MRIARSWVWLLLAGAVGAALFAGCAGSHPSPGAKRGAGLGALPIGSALTNLRPGDRIPAQGRTITQFSGQGKTFPVDAPIALYPSAVVQGVAWIPTPPRSKIDILLGTYDSEEKVLQYYANAWAKLTFVRPGPRPSILYGKAAQGIAEQSLIVKTGQDDMPFVSVQRGPAIQPADEAQFIQQQLGKAPLSLQPGGPTMTEIWLMVPVG